MRRMFTFVLFATVVAAGVATAGGIEVGVGAFGGTHLAIAQDDNGNGTVFGARVPVALNHLITVEPYFASAGDGDVSRTIGGLGFTRSGFDVKTFGASLLLTFGGRIQFYPFGTVGSSKLTRTGSEDATLTSLGGGLGIAISPMPKLSIHLRGEGDRLSSSGTGRVFASVTAGASYQVHSFAK